MEVNRLHVDFDLQSSYEPKGDQVNAIRELTEGLNNGEKYQTLLGATGTGKTFTIANIVKNVGKPTLVLAHNKTLAGQLYNELKEFFPNNRVEYFVIVMMLLLFLVSAVSMVLDLLRNILHLYYHYELVMKSIVIKY